MQNSEVLRQQLHSIHRKSYPAYKGLKGAYRFENFILSIDHVQGDPLPLPPISVYRSLTEILLFPVNITRMYLPEPPCVIT